MIAPLWPGMGHLLLAAVLSALVALAARQARALSGSGAVAAALVGFLLFGLGGTRGAVALLLFFVTSSVLSRWRKRDNERLAFEQGGERDAGQVLANGGVASVFACFLPLFPDAHWPILGLLGALATANADTWSTEIGALSRRPPRLITTFRPAPAGMSGAVSVPGTLAALAGSLLIAFVAAWWGLGAAGVGAVCMGGLAGALLDSLLGATLQAQYRCPACGTLTETRAHCGGQVTEPARGIPWLGNDLVNAAATFLGAIITVFCRF